MPASPERTILANIVKHLQTKEADPLTPLIEEYLLHRNLPKYRARRLQEVTLDLTERPRPGGRLSPSSMGGCQRQAAFTFLGVKGHIRKDPQAELIFADGHWRHFRWQTAFLDMGRLFPSRFRVLSIESSAIIPGIYVAGSLDAEVEIKVGDQWVRYIIDIKGANSFSFDATYRSKSPNKTYMKQLLTYMRARKCRRGILLFESKDRNIFYCYVVKFDDNEWSQVKRWARSVLSHLEDHTLPPKHPECVDGTFLYGRCPYRKLCYGRVSDRKITRDVYRDFQGVDKEWELGHKIVAEHEAAVSVRRSSDA